MTETFSSSSSRQAKAMAVEPCAGHVDHGEHAAFRHRRRRGPAAQPGARAGSRRGGEGLDHEAALLVLAVDGEGGRVLDEGLGAEEHGLGSGRRRSMKAFGPTHQPERNPGSICDLEIEETAMLRSAPTGWSRGEAKAQVKASIS